MRGTDITLDSPFFFSVPYRTYFVRPGTTSGVDVIKHPESYEPYNSALVDDSGFSVAYALTGSNRIIGTFSFGTVNPVRRRARRWLCRASKRQQPQITRWRRRRLSLARAWNLTPSTAPSRAVNVTNLNEDGVSGLLDSDTTIASDDGSNFVSEYDPSLLAQEDITNSQTYYQENVCFDEYGANSLYNWNCSSTPPCTSLSG